jgi:CelD/BcsL family acetyltransferase involved in cellulose biosynthesis
MGLNRSHTCQLPRWTIQGEDLAVLIEPGLMQSSGIDRRAGEIATVQVVEHVGKSALRDASVEVETLQDATGASRTVRQTWLESWAQAFSQWEPWVLTLVADGEPRAIAPLARRRTRTGVEVVSLGNHQLQESPVVALDDAAARELGYALVAKLNQLSRRWTLRLGQLPPGSTLASAFVSRGPTSIQPGWARPVLRFTDSRPPERWLSRNTRAAVAKARNRIARDGRRLEIQWLDSWASIEPTLPDLVRIHRSRDLELRGFATLDDPQQADLYHEIIRSHSSEWRLLAVRIDGDLAGYALNLIDGPSLHVAYNHVSPEWRRYSAGLLANAELVLRAAADPSVETLDWGRVVQRYKLSLSNEVIETETLYAWSSDLFRAELACRRRLGRLASRRPHLRLRTRLAMQSR